MRSHVAALGGPCANRRRGCIGRLRVETVKHRDSAGTLSERLALVCPKCGQAHGRCDQQGTPLDLDTLSHRDPRHRGVQPS